MLKTFIIAVALVVGGYTIPSGEKETNAPSQGVRQCDLNPPPDCESNDACVTSCASQGLSDADYCNCVTSCFQCGPTPL